MLPEREEEAGIPEHRADVDGDPVEESFPGPAIVQHPILQPADGGDLLLPHDVGDPPPHRRLRVVAEVVAVETEHRLEQQVELQRLDVLGLGAP